ncbi:MAG: alpha,alpha-phosphotrehalase [Negativicutes bacterium]|jgi:trehalose-6-phosphate hydrolase
MIEWWKKSVVYQIYPKSFCDTTGNGQGDLPGITTKLDYIKLLGVEIVWLTPVYHSPMRDNGYDISDYYSVNPDFGTMEDLEILLNEAHRRGLKIIMDIVVNHTSTEHKWFQEAKKSHNNKFRDYYIWRDQPNNWQSKFGGNAWEYNPATDDYYLHLFDVTQADLNWENPELRREIYAMMNFWAQKGIDGFRLDVINLISKQQDFLNDTLENAMADGRKYYTDGPRVHEFLQEMNAAVFSPYNMVTVGEMSSTSIENCVRYTNPNNHELSMTFSFHHLKVDYKDGDKWTKMPFDFLRLKKIISEWQLGMQQGDGWNALFWCNHDQPRVVSRFGDDGKYRVRSAKMLATVLHCLQGTPYIYQGEEIGMTNAHYDKIEQYRDVESTNNFRLKTETGMSAEEMLAILRDKSRDNSRTPMQWNASANAGFTTGIPWLGIPQNYNEINAELAVADNESVFHYYRMLCELRRNSETICSGEYQDIALDSPQVFAYLRVAERETLLVVANFYEQAILFEPKLNKNYYGAEILLANYHDCVITDLDKIELRPYEAMVLKLLG